jgi:murein DD-endopeptidase MepM/ murein hydrolase activator NlpD
MKVLICRYARACKNLVIVAAVLTSSACSQMPAVVQDYSDFVFNNKYLASLTTSEQAERVPMRQPVRTVTVQKGDSVSHIARQLKISTSDLISANNLRKPYSLKVGQVLRLPVGRIYTVRKGDFLSKIAAIQRADMNAIAKVNKLRKPYTLHVGQKLKIPYVGMSSSARMEVASRKKTSSKSSKKKATKKVRKFKKSTKKKATKTRSSRRSVGRFAWPIKGKLVSKFGAKKGGVFNDGINITARAGSKIKASEAGTVVYTGNGLKGYGNLMIIRHSGGWMTAYAHSKSFAVKKGQKIRKGQVIAYVGRTGNVTKPQVHFAIRKGRDAVDPMKYLAS